MNNGNEHVQKIVKSILDDRNLGPCVTCKEIIDPTAPVFGEFPDATHPALISVLKSRGVKSPYSHQARASELALSGKSFVIVTPTASGKTLCYNLPVISTLMRDPDARALYLFPTKALSQDQLAELQALSSGLPKPLRAFTYDGDTPQDIRRKVREHAQIVITNPDMLHMGILPHHPRWAKFFKGLKYVIIDEMHVYRGIFGSHAANVLRRLRRIAAFHGAFPVFLMSSATISNPGELAQGLTGIDGVEVISKSGAPRGRRHMLLMNPPIIDKALGVRGSPISLARDIASRFLRCGVQTIAFTKTRLHVEILAKYLKEDIEKKSDEKGVVRGYRGGYLPNLRREIETGLREGKIRGVVSTNALELGIDIGWLDASVIVGYPGSVASTWQRAGRAGRSAGESASILIASSLPLDQYVVKHPAALFGRDVEMALINPDNLHILISHIRCAAFELPFELGEKFGNEPLEEILDYLEEKGVVRKAGNRWHWTEDSYPADQVALRSADPENFVVLDTTEYPPKIIAQVDLADVPTTIHEGAIYMIEADPHHVDKLDWSARKANVRKVDADYYTQAVTYSKVQILEDFDVEKWSDNVEAAWGEVHVITHVPGYKKIKFHTMENVGYGEVELPDQEMHTTGAWWTFNMQTAADLHLTDVDFLEALAGIAYAFQHLAAMRCLCDVRDLGRALGDREGRWNYPLTGMVLMPSERPLPPDSSASATDEIDIFKPVLFLYEKYPGGSGLAEGILLRGMDIARDAFELVSSCDCNDGCPSCVGPVGESVEGKEESGIKTAALKVLASLVHSS